MPIDIDAVIREGNAVINAVQDIVNLAKTTQQKVGGISDLTSAQITELKAAAVVEKAEYEAARDLFQAAF